jgi:tetratricopeptide (TPR) repeat protein
MHVLPSMLKRWVIVFWLVVLVALFAVWLIRPGPVRAWMGLDGLITETPLSVVTEWAGGEHGPLTPIGCLSLFPAVDLVVAGALLAAIAILAIMLAAPAPAGEPGVWINQTVGELRFPGLAFRVRTALALVAILGLELGWEVIGSRRSVAADHVREQARRHVMSEQLTQRSIKNGENQLRRLAAGDSILLNKRATPAALAAQKAYHTDRIRKELEFYQDVHRALVQIVQAYEAAANDPSRPLPPGVPPFKRPREPIDWLVRKDYDLALKGFDELIRRYPDYPDAHEGRASILATCPDAALRNGQAAVASAKRACDLTNWQDFVALSTLAAASAEAGDFSAAVCHEQRAQRLFREGGRMVGHKGWRPERLASYTAGLPYHDAP